MRAEPDLEVLYLAAHRETWEGSARAAEMKLPCPTTDENQGVVEIAGRALLLDMGRQWGEPPAG